MCAIALAAISEAVGQAAAVADGIKRIHDVLDGARTFVLTVENHTNQRLYRVSDVHQHGGFKVPPNSVIEPQQALIFGTQDKGFMTGTEGYIWWAPGSPADQQSLFDREYACQMTWNNPFFGTNSGGASAYAFVDGKFFGMPKRPVPSTKVYAVATVGSGNNAELRCEFRPK